MRDSWFAIIACSLLVACDRGVETEPSTAVVYSRDIQPLLNQRCATAGCHDATTAAEVLVLDSWVSVFRGSENGAMVVPFRPEKSHLIFHVNTDSTVAPVAQPLMPPGLPLAGQEVQLLMNWVKEGARNDNGEIAFSQTPSGKVFVCGQGEDEIGIIDAATNLLMRMVPVGISNAPESPHNVTVDSQGVYYYVNLVTASEIWKFRVADNGFLGKLNLGSLRAPAQIVLTGDGKMGYVSNFDLQGNFRAVQVFDTQSMQVLAEIADQRMRASHGLKMMRNGQFLWTANQRSDNLTIIDVPTNSVVGIVKVDPSVSDSLNAASRYGPYQLVFSPNDLFAYVTCRTSNEVRVFNTQTRLLVHAIQVGMTPLILDITSDGQFVYVANRGSNSVSVIRTSDNTVTSTISNVGVEPHGVAITSDGQYVYVSCENINNPEAPHHPVTGLKTPGYVAVIERATNQVIKRIEVGSFGAGVAVSR